MGVVCCRDWHALAPAFCWHRYSAFRFGISNYAFSSRFEILLKGAVEFLLGSWVSTILSFIYEYIFLTPPRYALIQGAECFYSYSYPLIRQYPIIQL
jgi:hypothetical protein